MPVSAQPFDFPYVGEIDPHTTALLVIDLQTDFLAEDGYFARKGYDPAPLRSIIPTVDRVVKAARGAGCRIIWTRQGFRADLADITPYDRWRAARAGIHFDGESVLTRGGEGYSIVPELTPDPQDFIVDKTANNAFYQTDLDMVLRSQGITHLMFSGCTTDVCVHSTLREAVDRKYQCLLISDACASGDADAHRAAVRMVTIEDGIFGVIATSEAVVAGLKECVQSQ